MPPFAPGARLVRPGESLQAAIDSLSDGQELLFADGVYTAAPTSRRLSDADDLHDALLTIDKDVTLRALRASACLDPLTSGLSYP